MISHQPPQSPEALSYLGISYSVVKICGTWEPLIDGDYSNGLKCFEVEKVTLTVNATGGFSRKQDAIKWVEKCFPISSRNKKRGLCRYVWARNWKQAVTLAKMELSEVLNLNDLAITKAFLLSIPKEEIYIQSERAGIKLRVGGTKLQKILFITNQIATALNMEMA